MANLKKMTGQKGKTSYRVTYIENGVQKQKTNSAFEDACRQFYLVESHALSSIKAADFFKSYKFTVQKLIYYYLGYQWDKVKRGVIVDATYYKAESCLMAAHESLLLTTVGNVSELQIRDNISESAFVWLRAAFDLLNEKGLLRHNPCPKPKRRKRKPVIIPTLEEVNQLFNATSEPPIRLFFFLCAVCGLRTGEALGLKWSDIVGNRLCIQRHLTPRGIADGTKRGDGRILPVPPEFFTLLAPLSRESTYLIQGKTLSQPVNYQTFRAHKTKPLYDKLGLTYSNHALRHFAAATWLKEGRSLKEIQILLGHSTELETLTSYGHLLGEPSSLVSVLRV